MTVYSFDIQKQIGLRGERILDAALSQLWPLQPATFEEQMREIDRIAILPNGFHLKLEYKFDEKADYTGNAFIETVSTKRRLGWALASEAHLLIYLLAHSLQAHLVPMFALRKQLPDWQERYPIRGSPNAKYTTQGLLVPLWELARIGEVIQLR